MTGSPSLYFNSMRSWATPGRSSCASKPRMKPSRFSTSSTLARSFDAGARQVEWRARCALRMRVSISPRGSETAICPSLLPARLDHARDLPLVAQLAQLDPADLELAVIAARAPGQLAAQPHPHLRAIARQLRELQRGVEAVLHRQRAVHHDRLQRRALALVALHLVLAHAVAIDLRDFGHPDYPQLANGRSKARSSAFASASVFAVVTNWMSIPRTDSTRS